MAYCFNTKLIVLLDALQQINTASCPPNVLSKYLAMRRRVVADITSELLQDIL